MTNIIENGSSSIMNTYGRFNLAIVKGEGAYVYDSEGKKYLDFVSGIAVNSLGHGHKALTDAISEQAKNLIHISNLYWTKPGADLATRLTKNSVFDKVFFCNSGAEGIEAALKLARKYAFGVSGGGYEIIAMENSFHGRTFGAITATGQKKYQEGLSPLLPGIKHASFNDIESVKRNSSKDTCAVLVEPVQGESGIHPADKQFLSDLRKLCDDNGWLLIFDEVQCGAGRIGTFFAYESFGTSPDICVLAKGLAGGVPIGAMLATDKAAKGFKPGDHASTFGGNPLAAAAANVVTDELLNGGILENVKIQGAYLKTKLDELHKRTECIKDVRGLGLMQGIELDRPVKETIQSCMDRGLLLVGAGESVIRFVPPLNITKTEIDECVSILSSVI